MNFIRTTTEKDFVILQDGDNIMIVYSGGQIILNNTLMPLYNEKIGDKTFLVFDSKTIPTVDDITFNRVDEFIIYLFQNKLVEKDNKIIHLDGNTLNNNISNLDIVSINDLDSSSWVINDVGVQRDLKILFQNEKLHKKYNELINALKLNPYNLPDKFIPKRGLKYHGSYDGYQIYHAVIDKSEKDRVFYIIKNGEIILKDIKYKGIVQLLQALGHDF